jgi:hypothetical protein
LLEIAPNAAALRDSEGRAFLESMVQEVESGFFYHDVTTTPEKFKGMAARYNATGGGGAGNQIVKAGGAGSDNTSIWIVTWSENATHLIHPKGTKAGIDVQDKGEQRVTDSTGAYYVKEELFRWHLGVAVRDWRYNARVANIDVSDMQAGSVDLYSYLRQAFYKLQGVYATAMRDGVGQDQRQRLGRGPHGHLHEPRRSPGARRDGDELVERRAHAQADGARRARCAVLPRHPDRSDGRPSQHRNRHRVSARIN